MEIHLWCIVAAWLVVYGSKLPVAAAMQRAGGYDNHLPRSQQARLEGWGARSVAAHQNGFENFAPFAAAVLVAHLAGGPERIVDLLELVVKVPEPYTAVVSQRAAVAKCVCRYQERADYSAKKQKKSNQEHYKNAY